MKQHAMIWIWLPLLLLVAGSSVLATTVPSSPVAPGVAAVSSIGAPVFGKPIRLFNGKDLTGWTAFFQDKSIDPAKAWSVQDEILVCNGRPIGYLQTELQYENYELIVEWRFDPKKGAGNSGVLLRIKGEPNVWPNSIEAQLHSRNAGDIWNIGGFQMKAEQERTNGRRTTKAHETNEKPLGEWNRYRIRLDRGDLTLEVNGLVQNEASECEQIPGRIGLQSEGAAIEFKTVELRPIIAWK